MYSEYFSLTEPPFSITPDPRFLFLSESHKEALAHLLYGIMGDNDGFLLLTGEVGTGKTTICRAFINRLDPNVEVALILNPFLSVNEFLLTICEELNIPIVTESKTNKILIDHINAFLLAEFANGKKIVLICDEAQNLSKEVLEQIRLLTNLETDKHKLLQVFLIGQPELLESLYGRHDLRQLAQRITVRHNILALNKQEIKQYIEHRLAVAGATHIEFSTGAVRLIDKYTGGIPRLINILCDRSMLGAYTQGHQSITAATVKEAQKELKQPPVKRPVNYSRIAAWSMAAAAVIALAVYFILTPYQDSFIAKGIASFSTTQGVDSAPAAEQATDSVNDSGKGEVQAPRPQTDQPASGLVAKADDEKQDADEPGAETAASQSAGIEDKKPVPPAGETDQPEAATPASDELSVSEPAPPANRPEAENSLSSPKTLKVAVKLVAPVGDSEQAATEQVIEGAEEAGVSAPVKVDESQPNETAVDEPVSDTGVAQQKTPTETLASLQNPDEMKPVEKRLAAAPPQPVDLNAYRVRMGSQSLVIPSGDTLGFAKQHLLNHWKIEDSSIADLTFCNNLQEHGLRCFSESGSMAWLKRYDRPAILRMKSKPAPVYAVLDSLTEGQASLNVAGRELTLSEQEMAALWDGSFLMIWRPPNPKFQYIFPSGQDKSAIWLREALNKVLSGPADTPNSGSGNFTERLKRFQKDNGLYPDGIVGTRTTLLLQNRLHEIDAGGSDDPRL